MEDSTSFIQKPTSQQYVEKHLNMFWRRHIISYGDSTTSIISQLDNNMKPMKPQGFRITTFINEQGLEGKLLYSMHFAADLLLGYKFVDSGSKIKFEQWAANSTSLCLLPIQPKPHNMLSVKIHSFPLGLTQEVVKAQLLQYGTVNNFNYLLDPDCAFDLPTNNAVFDVTLKDNIDKDNFPTFLLFNGISILLFCKGWPPTCSYCKKRGHRAFECPIYYCTSCQSRVPRPHDCQSMFTSTKAFQAIALNDSQSRLLEEKLNLSKESSVSQICSTSAVQDNSAVMPNIDPSTQQIVAQPSTDKTKPQSASKKSKVKLQNTNTKLSVLHPEFSDPNYSSQSSEDESDLQHTETADDISNMEFTSQSTKRKDISTASEEDVAPKTRRRRQKDSKTSVRSTT